MHQIQRGAPRCDSCQAEIVLNEPPRRGPSKAGNTGWLCLWCDSIVCVRCYHSHGAREHPKAYSL